MSLELRNAYEISMLTADYARVDPVALAAIVDAGRFAIVEEAPAYCPITDGLLPQPHRYLVGSCDTRAEAEEEAARLSAESFENCGDSTHVVLPALPAPARVVDDNDWF